METQVTMKEMIAAVRKVANTPKYYKQGWDVVAETMDDADIALAIGKCRTVKGAVLKVYHEAVVPWVEGKKNTAFEPSVY